MSDFKAKMHQNPKFPHWGELTALPRPLAGFQGPTSKGRGGEGRERSWRVLWSPKNHLILQKNQKILKIDPGSRTIAVITNVQEYSKELVNV